MSKHIIHKQKILLRIPPGIDAYFLQNRISNILKNDLPEALETLFDKISPKGNILRIDKLELNLGTVTQANLDSEVKQKVIEQLAEAIEQAKSDHKGTVEISQRQSYLTSLMGFLEHGYLPWYSMVKDFSTWENEMLQTFSSEEWASLIAKLKNDLRINDYRIKRLSLQFSDHFLQTILFNLHDGLEKKWAVVNKDLHSLASATRKNYPFWQQAIIVALSSENEKDFVSGMLTDILSELQLIRLKKDKEIKPLQNDILQKIKRLEDSIQNEEVLRSLQKLSGSLNASTNESIDKDIEAELAKKRKKSKPSDDEEVLYIENCGIVILQPFLQMYFEELRLLDELHFKNETAQHRAVLLLHYLATGETKVAEMNLLLPKLICALDFDEPVPNKIKLRKKEKEESETLLKSVLGHWEPLHGTSIEGLRQRFFQREGRLTPTETGWKLRVEQKTVDILLDKLPWGYSTIKLPWMKDILNVEWG
jgi:hypothetical protein